MSKLSILASDIARKLRLIARTAFERRWKFCRFATRGLFTGLATTRCTKCNASNWYSASKVCSFCGTENLFLAIMADDYPCIACGKDTVQICENCEAPLCYDCDSKSYHDVLTCKDEAGCD